MVFYPDNGNRAARVKDLANNIAYFQASIKESHERMKASDARTLARLDKYAHEKGYPSIDEYNKAAEKLLTKEQRDKYTSIQKKLINGGVPTDTVERINRSVLIITGSVGFSMFIKFLIKNYFITAYKFLAEGISMIVEGAVQGGMRLISAAVATIRGVAVAAEVGVEAGTEAAVAGTEAAFEAGAAAVEATTAAAEGVEATAVEGGLSLFKIGTLATLALTAIIEIGLLIYEGVKGHEHMLKLQGYINDLVPRRFATKKIQMLVEAAVACTDDLNSMFNIETTLQPLVDSGDMPAAAKDKTMKKKLAEFDERWLKEHDKVTEAAVVDSLSSQDKDGGSWTKEDPDINKIREWLKKNPCFDPPSPKAKDLKEKEEGGV